MVDTQGLGPCARKSVGVQVLSSALLFIMLAERIETTITREVLLSARTHFRNIDYYTRAFGLGPKAEMLVNKAVLDLGTGDSLFPQEARAAGAKSVIACDGDYERLPPANPTDAIAAHIQFLPFPDNSFGVVLASWSFRWIETGLSLALREAIRVTKPGGIVGIHPVFATSNDEISENSYIWQPRGIINKSLEFTKPKGMTPKDIDQEIEAILANTYFKKPPQRAKTVYW